MTFPALHRNALRALGATALSSVFVVGLAVTPASAAKSDLYMGEYRCRNAQIAAGASSFISITKRCYRTNQTYTIKEWGWTDYYWRFEYVTRY